MSVLADLLELTSSPPGTPDETKVYVARLDGIMARAEGLDTDAIARVSEDCGIAPPDLGATSERVPG